MSTLEQLDVCQSDLVACKSALSASSPNAMSLFHHMETQRRQLKETKETLEELNDHMKDLTGQLIEQRTAATKSRHENYNLILEKQQLEEQVAFLTSSRF